MNHHHSDGEKRNGVFNNFVIIPTIMGFVMLVSSTILLVHNICQTDTLRTPNLVFTPCDLISVFLLGLSYAAFSMYIFQPILECVKEFIGEATMKQKFLVKNVNFIIRSQLGLSMFLSILLFIMLPTNGFVNIPWINSILFIANLIFDMNFCNLKLSEGINGCSLNYHTMSIVTTLVTLLMMPDLKKAIIFGFFKILYCRYLHGIIRNLNHTIPELKKRMKLQSSLLLINGYLVVFLVAIYRGTFLVNPEKTYPVFVLLKKLSEKVVSQQFIKIITSIL